MVKKLKQTTTNYPAGDFLIRLKNSCMANRDEVPFKSTKFVYALATFLKKQKFIQDLDLKEGILTVKIAKSHKKPVMSNLRLVSKPGLRIYKDRDQLAARKERSAILVVSTPKGIMTNYDAVKNNLGGEVIAEIW